MGLFERKINVGDNAPLYTTGMNKTILIVGLGNIGKEYDKTRHNIGFDIVNYFAEKHNFEPWHTKKDLHTMISTATIGSARTVLIKPTTLMNNSGNALRAVQHYYKIPNSLTLAVYDELDIDFGQLRTRRGGSSAGHNGIKSLIQHCGEDFARLRVGIGPKKPDQIDSADFVLAQFDTKEKKQRPLLLKEANAILSEYAYGAGELLEETRSFLV